MPAATPSEGFMFTAKNGTIHRPDTKASSSKEDAVRRKKDHFRKDTKHDIHEFCGNLPVVPGVFNYQGSGYKIQVSGFKDPDDNPI
jgi:hypothetical protein